MNCMALDARCALAMARVLAPIDPARASEVEERAQMFANGVAWRLESGAPPPQMFHGEELLLHAFAEGQQEADRMAEYFELHPPLTWSGGWAPSLDGRYETCPCIARSHDGFLPGLCISYMGGDCDARYGEAVPTLDAAIAIARARDADWHFAQRIPDPDLAR